MREETATVIVQGEDSGRLARSVDSSALTWGTEMHESATDDRRREDAFERDGTKICFGEDDALDGRMHLQGRIQRFACSSKLLFYVQ